LKPAVTIIGGGMITQDQILPSLYQLQRLGTIGEISIVALESAPLRKLAQDEMLQRAFPGQTFRPQPAFEDTGKYPNLYREVVAAMPPRNIAVVAVPDQLHYDVVMTCLQNDQHVLCVKPLVLKAAQAHEVERAAYERGLLVGIEYHKRFDDRSHMARQRYREGLFGEFKLGTACLLEKWYYRNSNFQNWFTAENSDAFTYIGCHYVDLVHFITGLMPAAISVYGIRDKFPNGNEGFLWTDARVIWSNGACLNVQNALGFPDEGPGTNMQFLTMYCSDGQRGAWIHHSDQYRGLQYCYTSRPGGEGATTYAEPSADYFRYVDHGGPGLVPVGYGYRSIEFIVRSAIRLETEASDLPGRQALLKQIDQAGIMATPANSFFNEHVVEAGRESILNGGREVVIRY
jgi:predicted dehydrogenase